MARLTSITSPFALSFALASTLSLAACGGGSDDGPAGDGGADTMAMPDGGLPGTGGTGAPDTDGPPTGNPGTGGAGNPDTGTPSSDGPPAGNPDADTSTFDESGKASLNGMDGITGIASGSLFAYTENTSATNSLNSGYILMKARGEMQGSWEITIPDHAGTFSCGMSGASTTSAFITLNGSRTGVPRGTAVPSVGGGCTIVVKRVAPDIEGSFTGTVIGTAGAKHPIVAGYFHFSNGLGDCSLANELPLAAGEEAATVTVTKVMNKLSQSWKCGRNYKFPLLAASNGPGFAYPNVMFQAVVDEKTRMLRLEGISGMGTFTCGQPGGTGPDAKPLKLAITDFSSEMGGTCTVNVTTFDATTMAGTYVGTGLVSPNGSTIDIKGSFRSPRMKP